MSSSKLLINQDPVDDSISYSPAEIQHLVPAVHKASTANQSQLASPTSALVPVKQEKLPQITLPVYPDVVLSDEELAQLGLSDLIKPKPAPTPVVLDSPKTRL